MCIGLLCRNKDIRIITLSEAPRCFDVSIEFHIIQSNDVVKEGMRFLIWPVACFKLGYSLAAHCRGPLNPQLAAAPCPRKLLK